MAAFSTFQSGRKGSKRVWNGQPRFFYHLGTFWARLDPFGPFQTKNDFLLKGTIAKPFFVLLGNKLIFVWNCPKGSRWAQKGPKLSKASRLTILDPFGPLWTTLECWRACHVWPFLFVLLVRFFGTPCIYFIEYLVNVNLNINACIF